jgi:hypothetical protein
MDFVTNDVQDKVKELVKLLTRDKDVSDSTLDRVIRQLRQSDGGQGKHTGPIKQRIRHSILSKTVTGSSGPALVSEFEQECETLRRMNSPLLIPFLALLEPLSYSLELVNRYSARINTLKVMDPSSSSSSSSANRNKNNHPIEISKPPSASLAIAGGLLPIVPPYHTSGVDVNSPEAQMAWVSKDKETKLIKDLLYIFQVYKEYVYVYI